MILLVLSNKQHYFSQKITESPVKIRPSNHREPCENTTIKSQSPWGSPVNTQRIRLSYLYTKKRESIGLSFEYKKIKALLWSGCD